MAVACRSLMAVACRSLSEVTCRSLMAVACRSLSEVTCRSLSEVEGSGTIGPDPRGLKAPWDLNSSLRHNLLANKFHH